MKNAKMLTIAVLALGLVAWQGKVSNAEPMGTAWKYQGRLMDVNAPADGLYDFQFKLFDGPNACKSVYSYVRSGSGNRNASVRQYFWIENPVHTACDYVTIWIGGDGYTTSSRYAWNITLILTDGINTHSEKLRCDCWGNNEGCAPDHYDSYDAMETGCDGRIWKRYTREIPLNIDKSNLTIKILHLQDSWDWTSASSWYHLDNVYFSDSEGNICQPIENGDFDKDPNGTSFNNISDWKYSSEDTFGGGYDEQLEILHEDTLTQQGVTLTKDNVSIEDGYFTVELDFGNDVLDGDARWLEIAVRPGDSNDLYTTLSPRQAITPAPYAMYAQTTGGDNDWMISGNDMYSIPSGNVGIRTSSPETELDVAGIVQMTGFKMPTGALGGYLLTSDASGVGSWQAAGGGGGIGGSGITGYIPKFTGPATVGNSVIYETGGYIGIGTTSPTYTLEVVGSLRTDGLRVEATGVSGQPNVIGGSAVNYVTGGVVGATISGGGASGATNRVTDHHGTVGGGYDNQAGNGDGTPHNASYATVSGGYKNTASGEFAATVGGGSLNIASGWHATIGGGVANAASSYYATVGGGEENVASGYSATIGGGEENVASGYAATVPGGLLGLASGDYSFAAGRRAKAYHDGAFVWADSTDANFASTGNDQFLIRASGGVGIDTNSPAEKLDINGAIRIGTSAGTNAGTIRWTGTDFEGYDGSDWQSLTLTVGSDYDWLVSGNDMYSIPSGNVGIGTTTPSEKLDVNGNAHISGNLTVNGPIESKQSSKFRISGTRILPDILDPVEVWATTGAAGRLRATAAGSWTVLLPLDVIPYSIYGRRIKITAVKIWYRWVDTGGGAVTSYIDRTRLLESTTSSYTTKAEDLTNRGSTSPASYDLSFASYFAYDDRVTTIQFQIQFDDTADVVSIGPVIVTVEY